MISSKNDTILKVFEDYLKTSRKLVYPTKVFEGQTVSMERIK